MVVIRRTQTTKLLTFTFMNEMIQHSLLLCPMTIRGRWLWLLLLISVWLCNAVDDSYFQCDFSKDKCKMTNLPYCHFKWRRGKDKIVTSYKDHPMNTQACLATPIGYYHGRICVSFNVFNTGPIPARLTLETVSGNSAKEYAERNNLWSVLVNILHKWHRRHVPIELLTRPHARIAFVVDSGGPAESGLMGLSDIRIEAGCCSKHSCVAKWLLWSGWSRCNRGCGRGKKRRARTCDNPTRGPTCRGRARETATCRLNVDCPVEWSTWGPWSSCKRSCDRGTKERIRACSRGGCQGSGRQVKRCTRNADCTGLLPQNTFFCNFNRNVCGMTFMRYEHCHFPWRRSIGRLYTMFSGEAVACMVTPSTRFTGRICVKLRAHNFGPGLAKIYVGAVETTAQRLKRPPIWGIIIDKCAVDDWRTLKAPIIVHRPGVQMYISATAGEDDKSVFLAIDDLEIKSGCCNWEECPARWSRWGAWSECSDGCGSGRKWRTRRCYNPANQTICLGNSTGTRACKYDRDCLATWSTWSEWTACYPSCDKGTKQRLRRCADSRCPGKHSENTACSAKVDCPAQHAEVFAAGDIDTSKGFNLFTCDFENGNCGMENSRYCNFTWSFMRGVSAAIGAHSGDGYMIVDYNNLHTDTAACITTPVSHYYGRVCIAFYVYLNGPSAGLLTIEAIPVGANPRKHNQYSIYGMVIDNNQTWHLQEVSVFLNDASNRLSFVAIATGTVSTSKLAIDDIRITRGCCQTTPCEANWENWSAWSGCDGGAACAVGLKTRERRCDNPSNETFCGGRQKEETACDTLKDCFDARTDASSSCASILGFVIPLALVVFVTG